MEIDKKKVLDMFTQIRMLEADNIKTAKYDDKTMVRYIMQIIQKCAKGD